MIQHPTSNKAVRKNVAAVKWMTLLAAIWLLVGLVADNSMSQESVAPANREPVTVTNMLQLRRLISLDENVNCAVRIEGVVLWASPAHDQMILQDKTGAGTVRMDLSNQSSLQGQYLIIEGTCIIRKGNHCLSQSSITTGNTPALRDRARFFFTPGSIPFVSNGSNAGELFDLTVDWASPWQSRETIPNDALWRQEDNSHGQTNRLAQGLNYCCYEGAWTRLPDFSQLPGC